MNTFRTLSDKQLIEAYQQALSLSLNSNFIHLLKNEIRRRKIKDIPCMHY